MAANPLSTTQPVGQTFQVALLGSGSLTVEVDPPGSGAAGPAPTAGVDDGGVALAGSGGSAGQLTYVKGSGTQALRWSTAASKWVPQTDLLPATLYVIPGLATDNAPFFGTLQGAINSLAGGFGVIVVPPLTTLTENIVIPATGGIEISCADPAFLCTIVGNWTDAGGAAGRTLVLNNIACTGSFTFTNSGTFTSLQLFNSSVSGDISIAAQLLYAWSLRPGRSASANYATTYDSTINLAGNITCGPANLNSVGLTGNAKTYTSSFGTLRNCFVGGNTPTFVGTTTLLATAVRNTSTFTGSVRADDFSAGFLLAKGTTVSGTFSLINQAFTKGPTAFAANVGVTAICPNVPPAGLYRVDASIVATALATSAASCALNIQATDGAGGFGLPVFTFNLGTTARASGSFVFRANGVAQITFNIGGITTPGPLAAEYEITLTPLNAQTV